MRLGFYSPVSNNTHVSKYSARSFLKIFEFVSQIIFCEKLKMRKLSGELSGLTQFRCFTKVSLIAACEERTSSRFSFSLCFPVISEPRCESKVDLCFVIDSSGSIRDANPSDGSYDNWQLQLEFLSNLVRAFTIGPDASQVGAVVFSEQVFLAFALNRYDNREDISQAILNLAYIGQTTNTPEALRVTRTQCFSPSNGDRSDAKNLVIVVTDGLPFPPNRRGPAIEEGRQLKNTGAVMVLVGITDTIDQAFLRDLSSPPQQLGTNYFTASDFQALDNIRRTVVQGTCESVEGESPTRGCCLYFSLGLGFEELL